jgi:hypothetical protein
VCLIARVLFDFLGEGKDDAMPFKLVPSEYVALIIGILHAGRTMDTGFGHHYGHYHQDTDTWPDK